MRPSPFSTIGVRPNSAPQSTSVSSSSPRCCEIVEQAGDRAVDLGRLGDVALLHLLVMIPGVVGRDLDVAHAVLGELARQQALPAEVVGRFCADAVQIERLLGSSPRLMIAGHGRLHAEREFVVGDQSFNPRVDDRLAQMLVVE